jgi:putative hemolysin
MREGHDDFPIRELVRPAYFVPETKRLDDLLREIRQKRTHMVIVVDEYGSVAGLVTIEDLVEEIVGDIKDEYDHEENLYEKINEDEYIFDAKINIYDFNELMGTHLDDRDYETLGGFVLAQLDKIPTPGDTVTFEDMIFTVLATRGRRITKVHVARNHPHPPLLEKPQETLLPLPPAGETEEHQQESHQPPEQSIQYQYKRA